MADEFDQYKSKPAGDEFDQYKRKFGPALQQIPTQPESGWDRGVRAFGENVNPLGEPTSGEGFETRLGKIAGGIADIPRNMWGSLTKSGEAMTHGDIPGAAFHLAGAVPIVGPMAQQFTEDIAGGKAPEAIGHGLGIGAIGLAARGEAPTIPESAGRFGSAAKVGLKAAAPDVAAGAGSMSAGMAGSAAMHHMGLPGSYLPTVIASYSGARMIGRGIKTGLDAGREAFANSAPAVAKPLMERANLPAWMEQPATEVSTTPVAEPAMSPEHADVLRQQAEIARKWGVAPSAEAAATAQPANPIRGLPGPRAIPTLAERMARANTPTAPTAPVAASIEPAWVATLPPEMAAQVRGKLNPGAPSTVSTPMLPKGVHYRPAPEATAATPVAEPPAPVAAEPPAPLARPGASQGLPPSEPAKALVPDRLADKLEDQDIQARYRREMHALDIEHGNRAKVSAKLAEAVKGSGVVPETPEQLGSVARERGIGNSYQKGREPSANTVDLTAEKAGAPAPEAPSELERTLAASIEQAKAKNAAKGKGSK